MGGEVKMKKLGGLAYDPNQVKTTKTSKKNGQTIFQLQFKNGETLEYPYQEGEHTKMSGSSVFIQPQVKASSKDGIMYDDSYYDISNVTGATFKSSKKAVSHVTVHNFNGTVDLSANDSKVFGDTLKSDKSSVVDFKLDARDKANINGRTYDEKGYYDAGDTN